MHLNRIAAIVVETTPKKYKIDMTKCPNDRVAVGGAQPSSDYIQTPQRDACLVFRLIKMCRIKETGEYINSHHLQTQIHFMENVIAGNRRRYYVLHVYQL